MCASFMHLSSFLFYGFEKMMMMMAIIIVNLVVFAKNHPRCIAKVSKEKTCFQRSFNDFLLGVNPSSFIT